MPTRSAKGKELIDSLAIIPADVKCNARNENGYCRHRAGFRTDHEGTGRCYLHGGRAGNKPVHGLYSKKMKGALSEEISKLANDPDLLNMKEELAVMKSILAKFLELAQGNLDSDTKEFFISGKYSVKGDFIGYEMSAESKTLLSFIEQSSKLYHRIIDSEQKMAKQFDIRYVYAIINQLGMIMDDRCGECPVRVSVKKRMLEIKVPTPD